MRKLKLDLTDLEVTSFETHLGDGDRGTVAAHKTAPVTFPGLTCGSCPASCGGVCLSVYPDEATCDVSCVQTCGTCAPSCDGLGSCDAMATCLQYYTCAYATCIGCV